MTSISKQRLVDFLVESGVDPGKCAIVLPKPQYVLPTKKWVEQTFAKSWNKRRVIDFPGGFEDNVSVCFDYAMTASTHAAYLHRRTKVRPDGGFCFGPFLFVPGNKPKGHVVNVFVYRLNTQILSLGFFEPQTSKLKIIFREEVNTASAILI